MYTTNKEIEELMKESIHNFLIENDKHLRLQWEIDKIIFNALREELGIEHLLVSDMDNIRESVLNYKKGILYGN